MAQSQLIKVYNPRQNFHKPIWKLMCNSSHSIPFIEFFKAILPLDNHSMLIIKGHDIIYAQSVLAIAKQGIRNMVRKAHNLHLQTLSLRPSVNLNAKLNKCTSCSLTQKLIWVFFLGTGSLMLEWNFKTKRSVNAPFTHFDVDAVKNKIYSCKSSGRGVSYGCNMQKIIIYNWIHGFLSASQLVVNVAVMSRQSNTLENLWQ